MISNLIIDLVVNDKITKDNVVVYVAKDRGFLYSEMFPNIINYEEIDIENVTQYCNEKYSKEHELVTPLWDVIENVCDLWGNQMNENCNWRQAYFKLITSNFTISKKNNILDYKRENYYNKYDNIDFLNIVGKISYLKVLPSFTKREYICLHFRKKDCDILEWNSEIEPIQALIDKMDCPIVIFCRDIEYPRSNLKTNPNLYFTCNLQEYVSFLKNSNCVGLISPWSGGGQIASYCMNMNLRIILYFCPDQSQSELSEDELNKCVNSPNAWDFVDFNNKNRFFIDYYDSKDNYNKFTGSCLNILNIDSK